MSFNNFEANLILSVICWNVCVLQQLKLRKDRKTQNWERIMRWQMRGSYDNYYTNFESAYLLEPKSIIHKSISWQIFGSILLVAGHMTVMWTCSARPLPVSALHQAVGDAGDYNESQGGRTAFPKNPSRLWRPHWTLPFHLRQKTGSPQIQSDNEEEQEGEVAGGEESRCWYGGNPCLHGGSPCSCQESPWKFEVSLKLAHSGR